MITIYSTDQVSRERYRDIAAYSTLILAGFLCYFNSLPNPFLWDDIVLVFNNLHIRDIGYIPRLFLEGVYYGDMTNTFYRPVLMATFALDYNSWGLETFGYHLTNIYLHVCNALLVYAIVKRVLGRRAVAFLSAAFFAVHPVNTEAVTYISGRADPLAAFLCLLSMAFYIEYCMHEAAGRIRYYAASAFFFLLAAFSKESALWFPVFMLVYRIYFTVRGKKERPLIEICPFVLIAAFYLAIRVFVVHLPLGDEGMGEYIPFPLRAITAPLIALGYVKMLLWPTGLHMERVRIAYDVLYVVKEPALLFSVVAVLAASAAVFMFRRRFRRVSFGAVWFGVLLIPFLNFVPINATVAEHWLYLPAIGFFIVISAILCRALDMRSIRLAIASFCAVIIAMLSTLTVSQNYVWRDPVYFYKYTLKYSPWSSRLHSNLGVEYASRDMVKEAETEYKEAIKLDGNGGVVTLCNLASLYYYSGREDDAIRAYEKAISIRENYVPPYVCMGNMYYVKGDFKRAAGYFEKAALLDPDDAVIWDKLGDARMENKEYDKALEAYKMAIKAYPYMLESRVNAGLAYERKGDIKSALDEYKAALKLSPGNEFICKHIGKICGAKELH